MKVLNFFLRMVYGAIGIELMNIAMASAGITLFVGLNPVTLLTTGVLGFSGVGLLFGIAAFASL